MMINLAQESDIPNLCDLLAELFSLEDDFEINPEKQTQGLRLLLDNPSKCCVMVAKISGEIVGMCTAQLTISTASGGYSALLEDLIVRSTHRGRGIGKTLLQAVSVWAREKSARRLSLLVDRRNLAAEGFYRSNGFKRTNMVAMWALY